MKKLITTLVIAGTLCAGIVSAQTTYQAILTGAGVSPPNASPGTGTLTLVLDAAGTQITVQESWSGLLTPALDSDIHGPGGAGTNAVVIFSFHGVRRQTGGLIPSQSFAITPAQVAWLNAGYLYVDIHTSTYPNGEIRGQITLVPEPGSVALLSLGVGALVWRFRRK